MDQAQMQELITLTLHKDSHADIFDLMAKMEITMDDFHKYSFQLCPGSQVHLEIDTISSIQPHVHRFYEVIFVVQGEDVNYILDSQRYQLGKGSMLFIPPGHIHHPLLCQTNSQPYKRYVLWFEAAFFQTICQWFPSVGYLFEQCEKKTIIYCDAKNPSIWNCGKPLSHFAKKHRNSVMAGRHNPHLALCPL